MRLIHLLEAPQDPTFRLEQALTRARAELKDLITRGGSVQQSGIRPEYRPRIEQKRNEIKALEQSLHAAKERPSVEKTIQAANMRMQASKQDWEATKAQRHAEAVKAGQQRWTDLAAEYGNEYKLNQAIVSQAVKQTVNGQYPLDVEQLANHFNVAARTMYKRITVMRDLMPLKKWFPRSDIA